MSCHVVRCTNWLMVKQSMGFTRSGVALYISTKTKFVGHTGRCVLLFVRVLMLMP